MHSASLRVELLSVPGEYISLLCPCNQLLSLLHPLDGEQRVLLFVNEMANILWSGCFPIIPRHGVAIRKHCLTVGVIRHHRRSVIHIEVIIPVVPIVILSGLGVELDMLILSYVDDWWVGLPV